MVVQFIVADVGVMPVSVTAVIVGMVTGVEKVKLVDVAVPPESVETAT